MHTKTMRGKKSRGGSIVEFVLVITVLVPLFLGTGATGVNMIRTLQTVQLARDAGHMYGRGLDFSQVANQTVLYQVGSSLGLTSSSTSSTAVVILSNLVYVDSGQCTAAGLWNTGTNTSNGCTNYTYWVFTQRLVFGNTTLRTSNLGTPPSGDMNSTTGVIPAATYAKDSACRVSFDGVSTNPYFSTSGVPDLPSGQTLYVAEAGAKAWAIAPFNSAKSTYSIAFF
jgi:hypothetical protein